MIKEPNTIQRDFNKVKNNINGRDIITNNPAAMYDDILFKLSFIMYK